MRAHRRPLALAAAAEQRAVPVGKGARRRVGGEVLTQPQLLGRADAATADELALRVQRDHVPAADVVAVPALAAVAGEAAEIVEVAGRAARRVAVLVVAQDRREMLLKRPQVGS